MVRQRQANTGSDDNDVQAAAKLSTTTEKPITAIAAQSIQPLPDTATGRAASLHITIKADSSWPHRAWLSIQRFFAYLSILILGMLLVGRENWHTAAKTADRWIAEDSETGIVDAVSEIGTVIVRTLVMAYGCYALLRDGRVGGVEREAAAVVSPVKHSAGIGKRE